MSEKAPHQNHEHERSYEHDPYQAEKQQEIARKRLEQAAEMQESSSGENITNIEKRVEQKAESTEKLKHTLESEHTSHLHGKAYNYDAPQTVSRAVLQARKQLKPIDRAFSKVVHNPKVEAVSAVGGATVARPSGMLFGALFSLIASLGFYVVSIKFGYEYNAFVGIMAFIGGFFFGLLVEMLLRSLRLAKK